MNNLLLRSIVATGYVVVMVGCTLYSAWTLGALALLLTLLAVREFITIGTADGKLHVSRTLVACGSLLFPMAIYIHSFAPQIGLVTLLAPYAVFLLAVFITTLFTKHENPLGELGLTALSQVYIVVPLSLLFVLAFNPASNENVMPWYVLPLALYFFVWTDDCGAYLAGSTLGRHKLCPRISPGKTWEGCVGGLVLALGTAVAVSFLFPYLPMWKWMGMAAVCVVFGTFGDLVESLMKRTLGIKDSGHLLSGHGGILDRIDSMLMALPAVVVYLLAVGV